jgi:hypothetical protein
VPNVAPGAFVHTWHDPEGWKHWLESVQQAPVPRLPFVTQTCEPGMQLQKLPEQQLPAVPGPSQGRPLSTQAGGAAWPQVWLSATQTPEQQSLSAWQSAVSGRQHR